MLIGVDGSCLRAVETGKQPSDLPFHLQAQAANLLVNQSLRDWLISAIRDTWLSQAEVPLYISDWKTTEESRVTEGMPGVMSAAWLTVHQRVKNFTQYGLWNQ